MDDLLAQEMLSFTPLAGTFDVEAVAWRVGATGYSFRDESDPSHFVISSDAASRDVFQAARRAADSTGSHQQRDSQARAFVGTHAAKGILSRLTNLAVVQGGGCARGSRY